MYLQPLITCFLTSCLRVCVCLLPPPSLSLCFDLRSACWNGDFDRWKITTTWSDVLEMMPGHIMSNILAKRIQNNNTSMLVCKCIGWLEFPCKLFWLSTFLLSWWYLLKEQMVSVLLLMYGIFSLLIARDFINPEQNTKAKYVFYTWFYNTKHSQKIG